MTIILFAITIFCGLATFGTGKSMTLRGGVAGFYGRGTFLMLLVVTVLFGIWAVTSA